MKYDSRVPLSRQNLNAMVEYIMKVKPQDPFCVVRYTHMDALCWYVFVSATRKKIPVDALGTLRITGIHFL
jgi:hypothetical protein